MAVPALTPPTLPMAIYRIDGHAPTLADDAFVVDNATVIGRVTLEAGVSVWFNAVLRGDGDRIVVGAGSNVQDGAVLHVTHERFPLEIGSEVVLGHGCIVHGCTLEDGCLIGIGARVLDGAVVERGAQVAAGAVVTPGFRVPAGHLALGVPARVVRPLTEGESTEIRAIAARYVGVKDDYLAALGPGH